MINKKDISHAPELEEVSGEVVSNAMTEKGLSEADAEKEAERFIAEFFKDVPVPTLDDNAKSMCREALSWLTGLKNEIAEKKQALFTKKDELAKKIDFLKSTGKVRLDARELAGFDESIGRYTKLLDEMNEEVGHYSQFYESLLSAKPPAKIVVRKDQSDNFSDHLQQRVVSVRRYIKSARKNLVVSYSCYSYGFDSHIRRIQYIEQVLKRTEAEEAAAK